jgi:hypothetical protein
MQIVALEWETCTFCDIEPLLRQLTDSDDRLTAARGRMFLELLQHLEASGPEPKMVGMLLFDELDLWPVVLEPQVTVTIRPDWYDYGPQEGGLPRMHYRVSIRPNHGGLSRDVRTQDLDQVEQVLRETFTWDT